jgi:hypothetical protein
LQELAFLGREGLAVLDLLAYDSGVDGLSGGGHKEENGGNEDQRNTHDASILSRSRYRVKRIPPVEISARYNRLNWTEGGGYC